MAYTVQGKPSIFPPCGYCGASYEAHEEVLEYVGIRGHRINRPDQPQHGMYHSFSPMPPNAHGLCESDSSVGDTSNNSQWVRWVSIKDRLPKHDQEVLICHAEHGYVGEAKFHLLGPTTPGHHSSGAFCFVSTLDQSYIATKQPTHWMPLPQPARLPKIRKGVALLKKLYESKTEDKDIDVCGFPVCMIHLDRIHDTETGEVTEIHLKVIPR